MTQLNVMSPQSYNRLVKGIYRVTLAYEGEDASFGTVLDKEVELGRFGKVTVSVRPEREFVYISIS